MIEDLENNKEHQEASKNSKNENLSVLSLVLTGRQNLNQGLQFASFIIGASLAIIVAMVGECFNPKAFIFVSYFTALAFAGAGLCNFFIHQIGEYLRFRADCNLLVYERARIEHTTNNLFVGLSNGVIILIMLAVNCYAIFAAIRTENNIFLSLPGLVLLMVVIVLFVISPDLAKRGWGKILVKQEPG